MSSRVLELGSEVIDVVTEFKGIIVARAIHLNGCDRYFVQPKVREDGKHPDGFWIDVSSLDVKAPPVALPQHLVEEVKKTKPGGFSSRIL